MFTTLITSYCALVFLALVAGGWVALQFQKRNDFACVGIGRLAVRSSGILTIVLVRSSTMLIQATAAVAIGSIFPTMDVASFFLAIIAVGVMQFHVGKFVLAVVYYFFSNISLFVLTLQVSVSTSPVIHRVECPPAPAPEPEQDSSPPTGATTMIKPIRSPPTRATTMIKPIREYDSDLVVVLDLDECLIHADFLNGTGSSYAHQVQRTEALGDSQVDTFHISVPDGRSIRVHQRPGLLEFLQQVSQKYETHIFTAGTQAYAKLVLNVLDPHGAIFTHCWSRESCSLEFHNNAYCLCVKNLSVGWGDRLKRTVLVDNNPISFLANPSNGILVSNFYNDARDMTLSAVVDLLVELEDQPDVRPILECRFGLKQALDEIQSGSHTDYSATFPA